MSLRVVHIIGGLYIGGAERHLVGLLNSMECEFRGAVFIGPMHNGPSFYDQLEPAIEQRFIHIRKRSLPLGIAKLVRVLRMMGPDVVHTHMFAPNLYGSVAAKLSGVPVVVTSEHGENPWKRSIHRWQERNVISRCADLRFCVSQRILELRRDVDGVPPEKLELTVNGTVVPPIVKKEARNAVPTLGAVGRFVPAKDYPCLLEAAAILLERGQRFQLFILGDGPEMPRVRGMVESLGLAHAVHLPGVVTDMSRWYRQFDIYVSSSMREGQPVALLEAMAHGLPVVATSAGASADTVGHGEGGLIVPTRDPKSLADSMQILLEDSERRERMGEAARSRIQENYSVAAVANAHLIRYRELLSRKAAS